MVRPGEAGAGRGKSGDIRIWVTGVNHRVVDLDVRDRLAVERDEVEALLGQLAPGLDEVVVLSTCNRTEVYAVARRGAADEARVQATLAQFAGLPITHLMEWAYTYRDAGAARHLLAVVAGLDSLVPGDAQIPGQVRQALELGQACETVGPVLSRFFREAINFGRAVRATTSFGQPDATVGAAAVKFAERLFHPSKPTGVLVIGAGKAASTVVNQLFRKKMGPVLVTNRTYEAAYQLATLIGGRAVRFDDLTRVLVSTDLVISATAAPHLVLRRPLIEAVVAERQGRPLHLLDIAVPRDIDPAVRELPGVVLHDLDDLRELSPEELGGRQKEADLVWSMVGERVDEFMAWLESLSAVPTIVALREQAERIRQEELEEALARLPHLSQQERQVIEALTSAIVNKLLHNPSVELRSGTNGWSAEDRCKAAEKLFGLK